MESGTTHIIWQFLLIGVLTLINAFFASAEMAIVSLNKNKIKRLSQEGNKKAILVEKLINEPTKFLSTIQVGITLAGFFSSAFAATSISEKLSSLFNSYNLPYSEQLSLIIITLILSYITLVFGELYPKRLALHNAQKIAFFSVKPILFVLKVAAPFVKLLSISTNLLLRITGIKDSKLEEKISREEIRSLVEVGQEQGAINKIEKDMINGIFEFDNIIAKDIMTPRTDVYLIDVNKPLTDYLETMFNENYSRMPVFKDSVDNVIGVLYMKDFFKEAYTKGFNEVKIADIIHTPFFAAEKEYIDDLFKKLQNSKNHIAILIDEFGGFSGIVTMEDLIEEIMGEIDDEFDANDPDIRKINEKTYLIKGSVPIKILNDVLYISLNENSENYETVSGMLIHLLGNFPVEGENPTIEHENLLFTIEKVKDKRIEWVVLKIIN